MKELFNTMKIFNPTDQKQIVDIEIEPRTDFIKVDLIIQVEEETVSQPINIKHAEFERWLEGNGYFDIDEQSNTSHPVTGEHVQTDYSQTIDYPMYLNSHLCQKDIYDFLVAMGRTHLKYVPE